jgi:LysR family hydrogen peroxide-inducible transcriptional activator
MKLGAHAVTLRQLQYAVAVAEAKNFRRAAALCHVAQPSLSAQLAALEDALGVRLFERDRRRVLVTPAGDEVLLRARRILVETDDLLEAAKRATDPLAGTLRIGVIPTISPYLLPAVVPAIRKRFPKLEVLWIEDKTSTLVEKLQGGQLDGALLALEAEIGELEREVVARDPFLLAAPRGHAMARSRNPVRVSEMRQAPVLLLDDGHCFREQALSYCSAARADELDFRATSLSTLTQMVAAGAGVTLLPALAVPTEARRSDVVVRELAAPVPHRTIAMVWRPRSALADALRAVGAAIRDAYPVPPAAAKRGRSTGVRARSSVRPAATSRS